MGSHGLWGLFDNAGISVAAPPEFVTSEHLRRQLEVNVVGQHAVTRAFIPLLRIARGRIVTTGSVGGFLAMPGLGPCAMSKHAMEAFSDSLRRELRPWGIHVALLEPGTIATDIWQKGLTEFDETMRAPRPRPRYCMGADSGMQRWIPRLPGRWTDALLAKRLRWG